MPLRLYCLDYDNVRWVPVATITPDGDITTHHAYAERELVDDLAQYDLPEDEDELCDDYDSATRVSPTMAAWSEMDTPLIPGDLDESFDPRPSWLHPQRRDS